MSGDTILFLMILWLLGVVAISFAIGKQLKDQRKREEAARSRRAHDR